MRPIIVLGAERSGTSLAAEMIQQWGAYLGPAEELGEPDDRNAHGRFEYAPLWELLAWLGDFVAGRSWWEIDFAERIRSHVDDAELAAAAHQLISSMESGNRPWAWKDPALAHFLTFWGSFWVDPVFVITVRNPVDIATSWQKFVADEGASPNSVECNLARWQHMMLSIVRGTESTGAKLFVEYEQVIAEPDEQARRLATFLDQQCRSESTDEAIARMSNACDAALRRNSDGVKSAAALTGPQKALYEFLRSRVLEPNTPFVDDFTMPDGWRELVLASETRT